MANPFPISRLSLFRSLALVATSSAAEILGALSGEKENSYGTSVGAPFSTSSPEKAPKVAEDFVRRSPARRTALGRIDVNSPIKVRTNSEPDDCERLGIMNL